jgi:hypothetical protein
MTCKEFSKYLQSVDCKSDEPFWFIVEGEALAH